MARINAPAPVLTGDAIRITAVTKSQGQICMTAFDYTTAAPLAAPAVQVASLVTQWALTVGGPYLDCMTSATSTVAILGQVLTRNDVASINSPWAALGTVVGAQLPLEMAAIITKYSTLKGQHGRGRMYMPAVPATFTQGILEPNLLSILGVATYNTMTIAWAPDIVIGAVHFTPAILTRPVKPATLVTRGIVIVRDKINLLLGTVRRRREGRGI